MIELGFVCFGTTIIVIIITIVIWNKESQKTSTMSYDQIMAEVRRNDEEVLQMLEGEEEDEDEEDEE